MKTQSGQTLIETVVAIFILVMGIASALGLAIYSLNASTSTTKQIIALGLAREGLEVVKNMRDTNWLRDSLSTDCYDFPSNSKIASCYADWLKPPGGTDYNIDPPSDLKSYNLTFVSSNDLLWQINIENSKYGLDYDPDSANGFYNPTTNPVTGNSDYYRKLTIEEISSYAPYNDSQGRYPILKVTSQVWWKDRRCPERVDVPYPVVADTRCLVTLETYLTNWKTY